MAVLGNYCIADDLCICFCLYSDGWNYRCIPEIFPRKGILGSEWVGLKYFKQFFTTPSSRKIIFNTLYLGIYSLIAGFLIPILLAILLNEMRSKKYKKFIQMVTYAPYFISTVVMVGMMMRMMDMRTGIINRALQSIGIGPINFFGEVNLFPSLYVWSGIWQGAGYSSIIYIAALAGVSPELQEAAIVDGANRFRELFTWICRQSFQQLSQCLYLTVQAL